MGAEAMTHTALKMARDALADLEAMAERYRPPGYPVPDAQKRARAAIAALDALQSTHPADASKVGAQIDMRDSVPSAGPRTLTEAQIERHTLAASECPPNSQVMLVSSIRRLLGHTTATTAPAPAQPSAEPVNDTCRVAHVSVYEDGFITARYTPEHGAKMLTLLQEDARLHKPAPAQAEPADQNERQMLLRALESIERTALCNDWLGMNESRRRFAIARDARIAIDRSSGKLPMPAAPPAVAAPLAQPLTEARILEMAAEAETPAWGEWYTDEDALFKFARAVEAHKGQP